MVKSVSTRFPYCVFGAGIPSAESQCKDLSCLQVAQLTHSLLNQAESLHIMTVLVHKHP